jgi:hypothetical protein
VRFHLQNNKSKMVSLWLKRQSFCFAKHEAWGSNPRTTWRKKQKSLAVIHLEIKWQYNWTELK